ncbi:MAG: hypothetical protein EPN21_16680, partial [Methylococcaceae bacterium]
MKKLRNDPARAALNVPTIDAVTDNHVVSVSNLGTTNDSSLVLAGKADAGSTVEIFDGKHSLGTVEANRAGLWSFTTEKLGNGRHDFSALATDADGNASPASDNYTVTVDATPPHPPTIESVRDDVGPTVGSVADHGATNNPYLVLAGKTEPGSTVEVFDGDASLGWGLADEQGAWFFDTLKLQDGSHVFHAQATDAVGNASSVGDGYAVTVDSVPRLTIAGSQTRFKAGDTATVTFRFSEVPSGFSADDVAVTGGKLSGLAASPDGDKVYTALFTPSAGNAWSGSIGVAEGTYTDATGNAGSAGNTLALSGDTQAPNLILKSDQTRFKAGDTATVTFSFSEVPSDFTAEDISVTAGKLSGLAVTPKDDQVYTALFTPSSNTNNLSGSIGVAAGTYSDAAGNAGNAGNTVALSGDTQAPNLTIKSDHTRFKAGDTATVTFSFSEVPSGFSTEDIAVAGGKLSGLTVNPKDDQIYTALFTPLSSTNNLSGAIDVAAESYTDAAGNAGSAGNTLALSGDTLAPSLTISGKTLYKANGVGMVTFSFSEVPSGFSVNDIAMSGGSLSGFSVNPGDAKLYTALFTLRLTFDLHTFSITLAGSIGVAPGSYTDAAGNAGIVDNTLTVHGDAQPPGLTISSSKTRFNAGETATVTFSFSEVPSGFS